MKKSILIIVILVVTKFYAQIGGNATYRFLDIPSTARAASLGGSAMPIWGDDINLIYGNPAALNKFMHNQVTLNYCNFIGDLNYGYIAYAYDLKKYGTVASGIQFFDYGKFKGYDENGNYTSNFRAGDYSLNMTYAKRFDDTSFNIGISVKTILSQFETYRSVASAVDFGVNYHRNRFSASILAKNFGYVWKSYTSTSTDKLPLNWQLGLAYKVSKAPFRLTLVYDYLNQWNLKYISPVDTTGQTNPFNSSPSKIQDTSSFKKFTKRFGSKADNFARHITIGAEIILTKNFTLRIAYNYRRQLEMILPDRRGINGFSFGFGFKTKRFGFNYAFTKMAFPGNSSIFNLNIFI
ncbi:MAG: type IX secretion system protein PorQ [Bacteroidetes bacterium]|nr:type IX secretion system protein PorQ [Bacteroidota bacterium]